MPQIVSSTDNPLVKRLRLLSSAAGREDAGLFLVEGRRTIAGFLAAGFPPVHLLIREGEEVPAGWREPVTVSERVVEKLSSASTPSGYLATFAFPILPPLDRALGGLLLVDVSDPGNMGTLIRSAAAFGIRQVALSAGADPWSPKVLHASAGAVASVQLHRGHSPETFASSDCAPLCGLVVRDGAAPETFSTGARWLVVGGEARGIPDPWLAICRERLTLPMRSGTESLNAAVAGSIAAYLLTPKEGAPHA